ncbi:MAG TPA: type II toxin-antitoxin system death-on-curing family toxin [Acidobacteriota bacterium]|nr:type II toxin-antitoxin system death-on-curing family toxin [Acidobacteriota bacterium]
MREPVWLDRMDCLAIHEMMLAQHGGRPGTRDEGLLESALSKPRNLFAYGSPTLPEMAASYAAGIINNHPFFDGNKRTGFLAAATFFELNGLVLNATEESVVEKTLALAGGHLTESDYASWLKTSSSRRSDS